jgi:hypothetical protein
MAPRTRPWSPDDHPHAGNGSQRKDTLPAARTRPPPPVPARTRRISASGLREHTRTGDAPPAAASPATTVPEPDLEHSWVGVEPSISDTDLPRQPPESAQAAIPSVERLIRPPAPLGRAEWLGWMAAALVLLASGLFYGLRYAPLRRELDEANRLSSEQSKRQASAMEKLSAELAKKSDELEELQLKAARAAESAAVGAVEPAQASEPTTEDRIRDRQSSDASRREAGRELAAAKRAERAASSPAREPTSAAPAHRAYRAHKDVDRAASAAATAALEARSYGSEPAAAPSSHVNAASSAPKHDGVGDGLSGVLDDSSDPLHGL